MAQKNKIVAATVKTKPVVEIEEYYDGFAIEVNGKRFDFDQTDSLEKMQEVFAALGFESTYDVVC